MRWQEWSIECVTSCNSWFDMVLFVGHVCVVVWALWASCMGGEVLQCITSAGDVCVIIVGC